MRKNCRLMSFWGVYLSVRAISPRLAICTLAKRRQRLTMCNVFGWNLESWMCSTFTSIQTKLLIQTHTSSMSMRRINPLHPLGHLNRLDIR
jgi:hypothetical protein